MQIYDLLLTCSQVLAVASPAEFLTTHWYVPVSRLVRSDIFNVPFGRISNRSSTSITSMAFLNHMTSGAGLPLFEQGRNTAFPSSDIVSLLGPSVMEGSTVK